MPISVPLIASVSWQLLSSKPEKKEKRRIALPYEQDTFHCHTKQRKND
jgi:hypothetical protein